VTKRFLDDNLDKVFGFVKLVRFSWSTAGNKLQKSCVSIRWPDGSEEGNEEITLDDDEENEQDCVEVLAKSAVKKEPTNAKKQPAGKQQTAKASKMPTEKNNSSILSFFGKSAQQKRAANSTSENDLTNADIVSHFLVNRKLKPCTVF
jgi:hypothetical protein